MLQEGSQPLEWAEARCHPARGEPENLPNRRSGHTFTVVGTNAFLFGGCDHSSPPGPTNDLFLLKIGGKNFEWSRVTTMGAPPPPRWRHSATVIEPTKILVFGGFHSSTNRFNDVWIFNTVSLDWSQPVPSAADFTPRGCHVPASNAWPGVPSPRGAHSANMIDGQLYIFGGYGGMGYGRRDFDDLHALNLADMTWQRLTPKGRTPERRSGHQSCVVDKSLYVFGGWNSVAQFSDLHVLDTVAMTWSQAETTLPNPRWNHASCSVMAIPHWKIFVFGGCTGELSDRTSQGAYENDILVLDTGLNHWSTPEVIGAPPTARSDTDLAYDTKGSKLILFGGWANRWFDDVYTLDVSCVVGPPYAIMALYPAHGAITGGTEVTIEGIDFVNTTQVVVRFSSRKGAIDVAGEYRSPTELAVTAPDFSKYGSGPAEVRVSLKGDSFTTTFQQFTFFAVTDAGQCLMFGPGILRNGAAGVETMFVIQARDEHNDNRTSGGDEFQVSIRQSDGDGATVHSVQILDQDDGTYVVTYVAPYPGEYTVEVLFQGSFGGAAGPIRGSGCTATFSDNVSRDNNRMSGEIVMERLQEDIQFLHEWTIEVGRGIAAKVQDDAWTVDQQLDALIKVKEHLMDVETRKGDINLTFERCKCTLSYLDAQGATVGPMEAQIEMSEKRWAELHMRIPATQARIAPLTKQQAGRTKIEVAAFEESLDQYRESINALPFWSFSTGAPAAIEALVMAQQEQEAQKLHASKMLRNATMFDCAADMDRANEILADVDRVLENLQLLWETADSAQSFVEESHEIAWADVDAAVLEEEAKSLLLKVKRLPKTVKASDAYKGLERELKDFLATCPLVSALSHPSMRKRHWESLMGTVGMSFASPVDNPEMQLRDLLGLELHNHQAAVEDITDRAQKEAKHEEILLAVEQVWADVEFQMDVYKDTDIPLVRLAEEDLEQLEADQLALQSILSSRYHHFREDTDSWFRQLTIISDVTQLLVDIHKNWSYLEPLFVGSEEVRRELPQDAERFAGIDRQVKTMLRDSWAARKVKKACMAPGLQRKLNSVAQELELCKKSLADFLRGKRQHFPRFYFTSEADLLDILSNSSQPHRIMRHISKVFLATRDMELSIPTTGADRPAALKFVAGIGAEVVPFLQPVPLAGKAEVYLQQMLEGMYATVAQAIVGSIARYPKQSRTDWLLSKAEGVHTDPSQVALLVAGMQHVREVENAFGEVAKGNRDALQGYRNAISHQLTSLISLTRGRQNAGDRQRVMNMITMDAHNRDVVEQMHKAGVGSADAFQWQAQLRQYMEGEQAVVRVCDADFWYGLEYLGAGPRLVVTPLTDRIYVTATQALSLKMGCAPSGPAGTGKTETTKDLAAALGKACYVINCSPEMDYQSLGNIFKGLASSGAWGCFDEFNRLLPEVLSVCSVQFKAVCDAVRAYAGAASTVTIEGDAVSLDPSCGTFITMNPGYLGRSELPEGLKALFRPITVMVPDLVLICENMLMAQGFTDARELATKFYSLYSLLDQLLSKQAHYDWGLRAVKSVLVVAGAFKRSEPELGEADLLMRALRDFNAPKIVAADDAIFSGLLADLFPGIDPPRRLNQELETCVHAAIEEQGLWPDETFALKVVQLQEILDIRHSVFVMGPSGAGKTTVWETLRLARKLIAPDAPIEAVALNPKAVTTEELYGHIAMASREWKDGLLSKVMRELGEAEGTAGKWIVLDGDLDPNWIESMNSVMDDNRMLTLASNERIPLKKHMRMLFEIRDLAYATPATVSRAGVLFISSEGGAQWRALVASWVMLRQEDEGTKQKLSDLFITYVGDTLQFLRTECEPMVVQEEMAMVQTLIYMLDVALTPEVMEEEHVMESNFVFAAVWAFGGALSTADDGTDYREKFSDWWRATWSQIRFPSRDTVFDYWLDPQQVKFEPWTSSPHSRQVGFDSNRQSMADVMVPTPETCSLTHWMDVIVAQAKRPLMLAGPAGTGKTAVINGLLQQLDASAFGHTTINFNYFTTSAALQTAMEAQLSKKTGATFGPTRAVDRLVYYLDDLNLPRVDDYGTQSASSLLRQLLDRGHWFDRQRLVERQIVNTQVLAALNPTAGSFTVNKRLQRHFATFAVGFPTPTSLLTIFQTFLDGHLSDFLGAVRGLSGAIIKVALHLHTDVCNTFRKTAANFHYEFSLRHMASVFQGLLAGGPDNFNEPTKYVSLWAHESERVYGDRLVSQAHRDKFIEMVSTSVKKSFPQLNLSRFYMGEASDPLIFCHFANGLDELAFDQASALKPLTDALTDALRDHNETHTAMPLTLFEDAVRHTARITRIIMAPGGHALLVGVGGSGKRSLARLAAHVCGYHLRQLSISGGSFGVNDLKSELQSMYQRAGVKGEGVLFLLPESHIVDEQFLVFINDLLSSGDVADLYTADERDAIVNAVMARAKAAGAGQDPASCWAWFIGQIVKNLHVALCFSPVGDSLRSRARRFPALINSTVIDWFHPWPAEALLSVAQGNVKNIEAVPAGAVAETVAQFVPFAFQAASDAARTARRRHGHFVHTTPKSFLEMLKQFKVMLVTKSAEAATNVARLTNGVDKLVETAENVANLEREVQVKVKAAEEKRAVAEAIAVRVEAERAVVEGEAEKAQVEREKCEEIAEEVAVKKADADADLVKAEPAVAAAMAALDTLNKRDLGNCKTMSKPPTGVDDVFGAVIVLLAGVNPAVVVQRNGKVKDKDRSWDAAKKALLGNINSFIEELRNFKEQVDNGAVPALNWSEVRPFLELDHFNVEVIEKKNSAAAGLCGWVINIVAYYDILVTVEPKRQALRDANALLEEANKQLAAVQSQVDELQGRFDSLTAEYNTAVDEMNGAQSEVEHGQLKLDLAQRLTSALGSERDRWGQAILTLGKARELLVGDTLLAAAFLSYAGPFDKDLREHLVQRVWAPFLRAPPGAEDGSSVPVPLSEQADPLGMLATEADIASWCTEGLPGDAVSAQNAAIVMGGARWPLLIDPQLQGIAWLKAHVAAEGRSLTTLRMGMPNLGRQMEYALTEGSVVIMENMGEHVDPAVMPVVARAVTVRGQRKFVRIGDSEIVMAGGFRLYLHTKLGNPHFAPELQAECTVVNFRVTPQGLEDQLLALVVSKERPDLAKRRVRLIQQNNRYKVKIKSLEDDILRRLGAAEGDITDDRELIEGLEETKLLANDVADKVRVAKETSMQIDVTSERYRPVAARGSQLFFLLDNLHKLHAYYIFSLNAFVVIFQRGIDLVSSKKAGGASGLSRLKQATRRLILTQRFNWNNDLLLASRVPDESEESGQQQQQQQQQQPSEELEMDAEDMKARVGSLNASITQVVFNYMRRGLLADDKLTVASQLVLGLQHREFGLPAKHIEYLTALPPVTGEALPTRTEDVEWLSEEAWGRVRRLEELAESIPSFQGLCDNLVQYSDEWGEWFDDAQPEAAVLPSEFANLGAMERMLLLRAMRPDRLTFALKSYITESLGPQFVQEQAFDMVGTYQESSASSPIFFMLFPGVDPTTWVEELGRGFDISVGAGNFAHFSMGQGQEAPAEAKLEEFARTGGWVLLQNIHLVPAWLPVLERKLEELSEHSHQSFRCFLSAEPPSDAHASNVPESLLQSCVKVANQAPTDLRSNLRRAWGMFNDDALEQCGRLEDYRATLFGLCFFHAIMLGRRQFGAMGWSRAYGFGQGDLLICADVLRKYLDANAEVPWEDLRFIFGEIMYGGHITDPWDRRVTQTYLRQYLKPGLLQSAMLAPNFPAPTGTLDHAGIAEHVEQMLPPEGPGLFRLHPNAEVASLMATAERVLGQVRDLSGTDSGGGGGGGGPDAEGDGEESAAAAAVNDGLVTTLDELLQELPGQFDVLSLQDRVDAMRDDREEHAPYAGVAVQECARMNALVGEMERSMVELRKGLNGQLNMSEAMDALRGALLARRVPAAWARLAWPSLKELGSWWEELVQRVLQLSSWTSDFALPYSLWLPGLFNPVALLTAVKQVTARRSEQPLDAMTVETHLTNMLAVEEVMERAAYPEDGLYVHGMFIEGAAWTTGDEAEATRSIVGVTECEGRLADARPGELLSPLPVMYIRAVRVDPAWEATSVGYLRKKQGVYNCPVYFTTRRGPEYVFLATLDTGDPAVKWVLAGVALIMSC